MSGHPQRASVLWLARTLTRPGGEPDGFGTLWITGSGHAERIASAARGAIERESGLRYSRRLIRVAPLILASRPVYQN